MSHKETEGMMIGQNGKSPYYILYNNRKLVKYDFTAKDHRQCIMLPKETYANLVDSCLDHSIENSTLVKIVEDTFEKYSTQNLYK